MKEQLCGSCSLFPEKGCFLKEIVADIVSKVPPREQQTPVSEGSQTTIEAAKAHAEIAYYRNNAREIMACPNVNSVNPTYPGRNGL